MMTKRVVSLVVSALGVAVLAGCPIYSDDRDSRVCIGNDCWTCPDSSYSDRCDAWMCSSPGECPSGYTCDSDQRCHLGSSGGTTTPTGGCVKPTDCTSGTCGADDQCHTGDCSSVGCPGGFVCKLSAGVGNAASVPACVALGGGTGDGGSSTGITSTCKSDTDCTSADGGAAGAKCLTGSCVAPADQCADTTQCGGAGYQCVGGACTPACSASVTCPTGYGCDTTKGVCTQNPAACTDSSTCGGKVCVEQHCVDPCGSGGSCGTGLVCVDGGCTPDQKPIFTCSVDGQKDACQVGSICLRHSCYIGCDGDAGSCNSADQFNQCKSVTTSSGSHQVCGSTTNLGSDCDPTQAKNCAAGLICIDGFCR